MQKIQVDDSAFPIVAIIYPAHAKVELLDSYVEELRKCYQRGKLATIVDLTQLKQSAVTAYERKELARRMDAITAEFPHTLVSEAAIMPSAFMRTIFVGYSWLRNDTSYPSKAFAGWVEARAWTKEQLKKHGLS